MLGDGATAFGAGAAASATSTRTRSPLIGSTALAKGTVSPSRNVTLDSPFKVWRMGFSWFAEVALALGGRTDASSNLASRR